VGIIQIWSAPAERSGDGAFFQELRSQSGVALTLATALQNEVQARDATKMGWKP
jgi:hypothetical protein